MARQSMRQKMKQDKALAKAGVPENIRVKMEDDLEIAAALNEGLKLQDIVNPWAVYRRYGARISVIQYRYGPRHPKVQEAIDESNRIGPILTSARSWYHRIMKEGLGISQSEELTAEMVLAYDEPENISASTATKMVDSVEKVAKEKIWKPIWSKEKYDTYRELQNIPENWGVDKIVLIWWGDTRQDIRVFLNRDVSVTLMLTELMGVSDLPEITSGDGRRDYGLTRTQYDKATGD